MARPALLIGLGGTGQWVLTYVKKELLDYTKGKGLPKEVRLISFDTTRPIEEKSDKSQEEDPIVVEGVKLDIDEYYHLGGNIGEIVREIAEDDKHPHIGSWLQAKTYLPRLGAGQYLLEEGAGQMRPFGRMAVFKDLESNPENSKIFGTLRSAIHDIRREVDELGNLEISIVASLAGGTGAGMAIDVAHIVRTIAEDALGEKFVIRGFFVLPRAFHRIPGGNNPSMKARAFAAIRELSRFLTVFGDRAYPMIYNPHGQFREELQKPVKKRLFDLCYLVDARRDRNSLDDIEPKFGVFPSIADAILGFIDEKSGQEHTEHVNNMMPLLTKGDDVAYFSAVGTYALGLPIREIAEENACTLALDFLKRLLKPEFDDEGRVIRLSSKHNQEIPEKRGSDMADVFMNEPSSIEGLGGTLFLAQASKLIQQGGIRNNQLLEQVAAQTSKDWLIFIEPDDPSEEIRVLRTDVRSYLDYSLKNDVKTSKELKEKPEFGFERIEKDVEQYLIKYLGRKQPDGSTTGGKFREGIDRYKTIQTQRFQKALRQYCIRLLNGTSETDSELSKSGKMGFVQEFLDILAKQIETFSTFMERVREIRQREGRLARKREDVQHDRSQMFENRKKSGLFNKGADSSQERYLNSMQQLVELEKDDMLFNYVFKIVQEFLAESLELKKAIDNWADTLAIGSPEQLGLYEAINRSMQLVKAKRQRADNFSRVRHEQTDKEFEQNLYERFASKQLEAMFESVEWTLNSGDNSINLKVLGEIVMNRKRKERDRPTEQNAQFILHETRTAFQRLVQEESIGEQLRDRYDEEDLARKLFENGSPLIDLGTKPEGSQPANFLAVKYGVEQGDEPYFRQVVKRIGNLSGAKSQAAKLVPNDGAHKCTLIYTIDVIDAQFLTSYKDLSASYTGYQDDRRLLHNFPAEVNAVYYEQRVRDKLRKKYRMFNPRIVFMLEYKDWVRQVTRCRVYDLIRIERNEEGNQYWSLHLPKCDYKGKSYNNEVIELTSHVAGKADFQEAMNTFIFKKKDCRADFEIPIHYNQVVKALIMAEEEEAKKKKEADTEEATSLEAVNIKKIKETITSGFIRDLSASSVEYERDLGDLMHVMLLDEIDRLTTN